MAADDETFDVHAYLKSESERQQFDTLCRAFEIFRDRSEVRGDLWAEYDESDALGHMKSKLARIETAHKKLSKMKSTTDSEAAAQDTADERRRIQEAMIDDALDLMNYAAFLVRHIEGAKP